jgi:hypothetical protein
LKATQYPWITESTIDLVQGKEIETMGGVAFAVAFAAAVIASTSNNATAMRVSVKSIRGIRGIKMDHGAAEMRVPI